MDPESPCGPSRKQPGPVGIVAASGTGSQELMYLLHASSTGVSHCLGVGGCDLSDAVGAHSTRQALALLDAAPATSHSGTSSVLESGHLQDRPRQPVDRGTSTAPSSVMAISSFVPSARTPISTSTAAFASSSRMRRWTPSAQT